MKSKIVTGRQRAKTVYVFPLAFRFMRDITVTFDNARINFSWLLSIELLNYRVIIGAEK